MSERVRLGEGRHDLNRRRMTRERQSSRRGLLRRMPTLSLPNCNGSLRRLIFQLLRPLLLAVPLGFPVADQPHCLLDETLGV